MPHVRREDNWLVETGEGAMADEFVFETSSPSDGDGDAAGYGWFALPEVDDEVVVGMLLPAVQSVPDAPRDAGDDAPEIDPILLVISNEDFYG